MGTPAELDCERSWTPSIQTVKKLPPALRSGKRAKRILSLSSSTVNKKVRHAIQGPSYSLNVTSRSARGPFHALRWELEPPDVATIRGFSDLARLGKEQPEA